MYNDAESLFEVLCLNIVESLLENGTCMETSYMYSRGTNKGSWNSIGQVVQKLIIAVEQLCESLAQYDALI